MRLKDVEYSIQKYIEGLGFKMDSGDTDDTGLSIVLLAYNKKTQSVGSDKVEYEAIYTVIGTASSHTDLLDLLSDYMEAPINTKSITIYNVDTKEEVFTEECDIEIDGTATVDPVDGKSFTDGLTVSIMTTI